MSLGSLPHPERRDGVVPALAAVIAGVARYRCRVGKRDHWLRERLERRRRMLVAFPERLAGWIEIRCLKPGTREIVSVGCISVMAVIKSTLVVC